MLIKRVVFVVLALFLSACGYDFQSKLKAAALDLEKAEFDEQAWLSPKSGTAHARKFPLLRVNFARAAEPGAMSLVSLEPGDLLFLGAYLRGSLQAEPETGWAQATVISSLQDTFVEVKDILLPVAADEFSSESQYVLAVKVMRGTGESAREVVRVSRVAAFMLDLGSVEASVPSSTNGVDPSKPIGVRHRYPSFGFRGACKFSRGGVVGADVHPGDVAYATLFGLRVSEILDLSRYNKRSTGEYPFMLYIDTSALPETTVNDTTGWGAIHLVCETSSGRKNEIPTRLASGVDFTPPSVVREVPNSTGSALVLGPQGNAELRFSVAGATAGPVTFFTALSSFGGAEIIGIEGGAPELEQVFGEVRAGGLALKAASSTPSVQTQGFQAQSSTCSGGSVNSHCFIVSVASGRLPSLGNYSIRVPFYDEAGNETIAVVPMSYSEGIQVLGEEF